MLRALASVPCSRRASGSIFHLKEARKRCTGSETASSGVNKKNYAGSGTLPATIKECLSAYTVSPFSSTLFECVSLDMFFVLPWPPLQLFYSSREKKRKVYTCQKCCAHQGKVP
eukprot:801818-Pelagomonas_calceolata.AAC.1